MNRIARHKWLLLSFAVTVAHGLSIALVGANLVPQGILSPGMWIHAAALFYWHLAAVAIAVLLGAVAIARERPRLLGLLGVALGLFSFFFLIG